MINESFLIGFLAGGATAFVIWFVCSLVAGLFRPWVQMMMSGGRGSLLQIVGMRLRGTPPSLIIEAYTQLLHAGEQVSIPEVESQYIAHRSHVRDAGDLVDRVRAQKQVPG